MAKSTKLKSIYAKCCIRYTMSLPIATLISGIDSMEVLEKNLKIASNFMPMSKQEKEKILSEAEQYAKSGKYEPYKK